MGLKFCPACKKNKAFWHFKTEESYSCLMCDVNRRARVNRYKGRNRPFVNQITRAWRKTNPEKAMASVINWQKENPEKVKGYRKTTYQNAMKNLDYRVAATVRARIHKAITGGKKSANTDVLMGGREKYVKKIESLLRPGWNWNNYGTVWEIDHIRPICSFQNLATDAAKQRAAFHHSNVQPLSIKENRSKGGRWKGKNS